MDYYLYKKNEIYEKRRHSESHCECLSLPNPFILTDIFYRCRNIFVESIINCFNQKGDDDQSIIL